MERTLKEKRKQYFFIEYNAKFIAMYKTIRGALNFIERKGLEDNYDNSLIIVDRNGNMYSPITGKEVVYE